MIAQKKRPGALNATQKNPSSLPSTDSEKIRIQSFKQKHQKWKFWEFIFLFFLIANLFKEMGSFALRSVHHNASFELSNTAFGQFFRIFTIRISMTKLTQKWVVEV